ncbi:MAG: DUF2231 domain-containing protein [Acidimicrobiia bacterium]|nr:DUF2231 domain-containing protein [Acidimicrobiia bacterium]
MHGPDEHGGELLETTGRDAAKRPASAIAGSYGHPIHPILVTVPIGAWIASFVFDVTAHLVDDAPGRYTDGATLLVAIGVIGAVVAAIFGFIDYRAIAAGTVAKRTATTHLLLNDVVIVLFAVSWIVRQGTDDARTPVWLIVLSAVGLVVLGASGYLGGKLSYRFGVRVADEATQAEGFRPPTR